MEKAIITYDKTSPKSIEAYSKRLIGKTFRQVIEEDENSSREERKANKGNLGQIIEENFFHYECNGISAPDFEEAGVELKVSPYRVKANGDIVAKERLVLTMIDYFKVVKEQSLERSHLWYKCRLMLIIYYQYKEEIEFRIDYRIGYSKLFTPPEQDLKIIRQDFIIIRNKVLNGRAHELTEADTLYLSACPKSANSTITREQPFSDIPAKPRAFAYKNSYMTFVLNHYIVRDIDTYEPVVKEDTGETFEEYVIRKISNYKGYTLQELCRLFGIDESSIKSNKGIIPTIIYRILGIKGNHAEEFEKAGIVIKTIRVSNGGIKESMSFPTFKFKELVKEDWENSTIGNYLRETKFLFVVFSKENDTLFLRGCQFWNIPYTDLEYQVKSVWERTKKVIQDGIEVRVEKGRRINNLPKMTENRVCHIRPHAKNSLDTDELPNGQMFPKQCFWLNSKYIYSQLEERLK